MKTIRLSDQKELEIFLKEFYEKISYDDSPAFEDYVPSGIWFTLMDNDFISGFINVEPITNVMWNCHVMLYEVSRGNGSEEWAIQVAEYMKEQCGAKRFLAFTPYENARRYAERAGFKYVTTLLNSVKKNGKLLHQHLLEL